MKKIKWLATGGTISSIQTKNGLHPAADKSQMNDMLRLIPETDSEIYPECIMSIDSSDISAADMKTIGSAAAKAIREDFNGIVITHGTDTMAYTSAVMRKMLSGTPIPVIITGSQRPFYSENSDGRANLFNALKAAADSSLKDVFLLFGDKLIRGDRAHKDFTENDNAFVSTCGYSGIIENGRLTVNEFPQNSSCYRFRTDMNENVMLIKLSPLTDGSIFSYAADIGIKGIVIEGFGSGGIPHRLLDSIGKAISRGIKIMLISQCLYDGVDMSIYEVGNDAARLGIISGGNMSAEAAVAEMMFMI